MLALMETPQVMSAFSKPDNQRGRGLLHCFVSAGQSPDLMSTDSPRGGGRHFTITSFKLNLNKNVFMTSTIKTNTS